MRSISFGRSRAILITAAILLSAVAALAQKGVKISEIQSDRNYSPYADQYVKTEGIVTARIRNGFFIQTPDDAVDTNPETSEGIFVFTSAVPPSEAALGNFVSITGDVAEFRPKSDPTTLSTTNIVMRRGRDVVRVLSSNKTLPKPIELTREDFRLNSIDQLEKYEGMRVSVPALTVIAPTDGRYTIKTDTSESNGTFFGVLKGIERPFREPGYDIYDLFALDNKKREEFKASLPKLQVFDNNPERLRIESAYQEGAGAIEATSGSTIEGLTGVLHYSYRTNTILVDAKADMKMSGMVKAAALPKATEKQFSVAAMNLENFFDDIDDPAYKEDVLEKAVFDARLKKISWAVRDYMKLPDVIGMIEVESLEGLKKLAERINADVKAAGDADPKYQAYLEPGNDGRGIDNGYLVKASRVKVLEVKQLGKEDKFKNPNTKEDNFLNDRPPLMLRAAIKNADKDLEVTFFVNHLKSYLGYNDPKQMDNVRLKKKLQAEYLAKIIQERQKANPAERLVLMGDFNSYQFPDGILDQIGTIKGSPAKSDAVMMASDDLVTPDLVNLVEMIDAKQRYSYTYDGNAQVLDHMLVSQNLIPHTRGFGFVRLNADFPESYRNKADRVERFSDHDPSVAYFNF